VVADFRAAHEVSAQTGSGSLSTEQLRGAMVRYRAVLDALLGHSVDAGGPPDEIV
jgi:hypothetical protein